MFAEDVENDNDLCNGAINVAKFSLNTGHNPKWSEMIARSRLLDTIILVSADRTCSKESHLHTAAKIDEAEFINMGLLTANFFFTRLTS